MERLSKHLPDFPQINELKLPKGNILFFLLHFPFTLIFYTYPTLLETHYIFVHFFLPLPVPLPF